jgi:mRNA interferase MazF
MGIGDDQGLVLSMKNPFPRRGEIWLVVLDPVLGAEIGKTRPALVLSNDRNNEFADTATVLPVTSKAERVYPFEWFLPAGTAGLSLDSKAKANQIRTVAKERLIKRLGQLDGQGLAGVERAVLVHLGIFTDRR